MALAFMCGFDGFSVGTEDVRKIFSGGNVQASGGAFGGKRLWAQRGTGPGQARRIGAANAISAIYAAGWLCANEIGFGEAENRAACVLSSGYCAIRSGSFTPVVTAQFSAFQLPAWVEVGCYGGRTEIWVNGLLRLSHTAEISTNLQLIASDHTISSVYVDDLVFWNSDPVGDGFDTFPIGPQRIATLQNTGAGSMTEWTSLGGENWQATTATSWAGGVGVQADATDLTDLYRVSPLPWNSSRFRAVQPWIAGVSDAGGGSVKMVGNVGGTPYESAAIVLPLVAPEIMLGPLFIVDGHPPSILDTAEFGVRSA